MPTEQKLGKKHSPWNVVETNMIKITLQKFYGSAKKSLRLGLEEKPK